MSWVGISVTSDSTAGERKVLTTDSRKQDLGGAKPIIKMLFISRNEDTTILLVMLVMLLANSCFFVFLIQDLSLLLVAF